MTRPARGLTLIEVLVALAIVAITLAAGMKAAGALTNNTERLADVIAAQWCAGNQLAFLRRTRQFPSVGDSEFTCEQGGRNYAGRMVVRNTLNPNFRRLDLHVSDERGGHLLMETTVLPRGL